MKNSTGSSWVQCFCGLLRLFCPGRVRGIYTEGHIGWGVRMLWGVFPVECSVTDGQKLRGRETQAGRSTIDPLLRAFELEIYTDRSLIDGDDPGLTVGLEFRAVLLIAEAGMVPQTFEYQRKGIRIGNFEFN